MKQTKQIPMFIVGDRVVWFSSGTKKMGTVVLVVDKGSCPSYTFDKSGLEKEGFRFTTYGGGCARDHRTYLVALDKLPNGTTQKVYWPFVGLLKKVE